MCPLALHVTHGGWVDNKQQAGSCQGFFRVSYAGDRNTVASPMSLCPLFVGLHILFIYDISELASHFQLGHQLWVGKYLQTAGWGFGGREGPSGVECL